MAFSKTKIAERFNFEGSVVELTEHDYFMLRDTANDRGTFGQVGDRKFKAHDAWIAAGFEELHVPYMSRDVNQELAMKSSRSRKVRLTAKGHRFMAALDKHQDDDDAFRSRLGPAVSDSKFVAARLKAGKMNLAKPKKITIRYGRICKD